MLRLALATLLVAVAAVSRARAEDDLLRRIDASLARAERYLLDAQDDDGAWHSSTYGALRTGPTLTPYVMSCLPFLPRFESGGREAYQRGVRRLMHPVDFNTIVRRTSRGEAVPALAVHDREYIYPIYTAAMASRMVAHPKPPSTRQRQAQLAFLDYVLKRQFAESNGWSEGDIEFGGWGFAIGQPVKPTQGPNIDPMLRSNLSATTFAVGALRSAGVPPDDPAYAKALLFVTRCQNYDSDRADTTFDDGGFFFTPGDAAQNKAGAAGRDRHGDMRFRSYGTMTADGLRCLLQLGLDLEHPRVRAAADWLATNFSAEENPGDFPPHREVLRGATYYYWAWSIAHGMMAVRRAQATAPQTPQQGVFCWADDRHVIALAEALLARQHPDGTWTSRFTDAKEDDPLVSTPWAAAALAICKALLTESAGRAAGDACNAHR